MGQLVNIGIVGHEAAKFNVYTEAVAKQAIRRILGLFEYPQLVSGHCHLGGIDIWAEEIADKGGISKIIHPPDKLQWSGGYRERNLKIARDSDIVYVLVVDKYPVGYSGMRFDYCYHCNTSDHIKSGGCWTGKEAKKLGKPVVWYIMPQVEIREVS